MLRETQHAAQQVERELRDQLSLQASLLAQAQSECSALHQRLGDSLRQFSEEKKSHEGTRTLLAGALAGSAGRKTAPRGAGARLKAKRLGG